MKLKEPLTLVLIGQFVVLFGAVGFMAGRLGAAPAPAPVVKAAEEEEDPEDPVELPPVKHGKKKGGHTDDGADAKKKKARAAALAHEDEAPPAHDGAEHAADHGGEAHGEGKGAAKDPKAHPPEHADKHAADSHAAEPHAEPQAHAGSPPSFEQFVQSLVSGNDRAVEGAVRQRDVLALRERFGGEERADALIITCTDSRVVPEQIFDQPAGTFSVFRLPAAQVDESTVRAVDEALKRLEPRAVLVLGHVGCHHVDTALLKAGKKRVPRPTSLTSALAGLQGLPEEARDEAATAASISYSAFELRRRSKVLGKSDVTVLRVLYTPTSGQVRWLDGEEEATPAAPRAGRADHH